jgi:hypothetical protein
VPVGEHPSSGTGPNRLDWTIIWEIPNQNEESIVIRSAKIGAYCILGVFVLALASEARAQFKPVSFPKHTGVPGFVFPVSQETIDKWNATDNIERMAEHAWGIWVGLNMPSGEKYQGQELRVFETWNTTDEVTPPTTAEAARSARPRSLTPKRLRQFRFRNGLMLSRESIPSDAPLGFVKYDPSAADFILKHKIISTTTLNKLIVSGQIGNVPDLPNTSIAIKVQTDSTAPDPMNPGYHKLNVWPGPPNPAAASGEGSWPNYVWIDLNPKNPSTGDGSSGVTRMPANTYSINDFLHFANDGTTLIVVGMHVTTREASNWSWQTFWWAPEATKPPLPSSQNIASVRPEKLLKMGAPAHYSVALAYSMRTSKGGTVFGYNPYLEGRFSGLGGQYQFGVQSNCMSCHANASYQGITNNYVGDENVNIAGPQFQGQVRLDFLYSLSPNQ